MKTVAPGISAEEGKGNARMAIVFYPRLGKLMFFIFLLFYVWFMYVFTQPGSFNSEHFAETLIGYGMFFLLFSPMLYLGFFLWKGKTMLVIRPGSLRMYYSMPAWFGKKIQLPAQPQSFQVRTFSVVNKGTTTRYYMVYFMQGETQVDFTYFYFPDQAEAAAAFLSTQWERIHRAQAPGAGGRRSDI